jgi:hypothetical protein
VINGLRPDLTISIVFYLILIFFYREVFIMQVIVAGSRSFTDYSFLERKLTHLFSRCSDSIGIVSGTARGADMLGERYAAEHGMRITRFPADWDRYKKSAGYRRNVAMAQFADALVAFWDGHSRGTGHMIDLAREYGLRVRVVRV